MKIPKPVKVNWVDSAASHGWLKAEEIDVSPAVIKSIGWLVARNKKNIVISTSWHVGEDRFSDPMTIPLCAVKKLTFI